MLMALAVTVSMLVVGCGRQKGSDAGTLFYNEVRSVNKLVLSRMTITKVATLDDLDISKADGLREQMEAIADMVKIGDRIAAYSYDTYLDAFIDMSAITPDDIIVNQADSTVTFNLPGVQTEFKGRDMALKEMHYRVTGLRSQIKPAERAAIKEKCNTLLKKEVETNDKYRSYLVKEAEAKARDFFSGVASEYGYKAIVTFDK